MPKRYEVLERSFLNGRLYEPGETVLLEIDGPGSNLKLVGQGAPKVVDASIPGKPGDSHPDFSAKHNGGGRYVIVGKSGDRTGEFTGSKEEAESEAVRLNAGGTPSIPGKPGDGSDETRHSGLPDA